MTLPSRDYDQIPGYIHHVPSPFYCIYGGPILNERFNKTNGLRPCGLSVVVY